MSRSALARILLLLFLLAIAMGAGPGLFLVNPDPGDPEARRFVFGIPAVYLWAVLWLAVQSGIVVLAHGKLWKESRVEGEDETETENEGGSS